MIRESDVWNAPITSNLHAAWPGRVTHGSTFHVPWSIIGLLPQSSHLINIYIFLTLNMLGIWTNVMLETFFIANEQSVHQVPAFLHCDSFRLATSIDVRIVDFFARWLLSRESFRASTNFIKVVEVWKTRNPPITTTPLFEIFILNVPFPSNFGLLWRQEYASSDDGANNCCHKVFADILDFFWRCFSCTAR